ncbi:hypothetical protein ONE63_007212 [Megalurothrips usitatus]|uniref:Major facilitator superfamily (MFS) profile domain-containing protein n=1 Tax=Megalurothrips usitatus TaxID=439358 RepID=A0AAV7XYB4_9NEOP|nr:hypothetical protein ONE63_007212 [Megalurothrips usitatus]
MTSSSRSSLRSAASQSLSALAVFLINVTTGMGLGWSSPAWAKLTEVGAGGRADAGFLLDVNEASWVVAVYDVGIPVGSVLAGLLLGSLGRRRTLMLSPLLVLAASALTFEARSSAALIAARVLMGTSFGLDLSCSSLYIGEIAHSDTRGKLCTFTTSLVFVGVLAEFVIGPYVAYPTQALLPVAPALLSLAVFLLWAPESPYFLASRGRVDEMRRALARLRGVSAGQHSAAVDKEAEDILRATESGKRRSRAPWRNLVSLTDRGARRGCLIVLFLCGTGPMVGTGSVVAYGEYLFKTTGSGLSADMSAIVMCSVQVLAGVASSQVIDRAGRRPLLLGTALVNACAMAGAGVFFFIKDALGKPDAAAHISWLPLASLMLFMVSTNLGTTTVPWVMIGELLPQQSKALVPSLSVLAFSVVAFATNKLLPVLGQHVGLYLPFWAFGAWSVLVFFFTLILVPETRGKTLLEVQAMLQGKPADGSLSHQDAEVLQEEDLRRQQQDAEDPRAPSSAPRRERW